MLAGAVQLNATEDTDRNLETADRLVHDAAARGAELVVLPEKWSVLGKGKQMAAAAEQLNGRWIEWARTTARDLGIDLIAGSIVERVEGRAKTSNTSVHVGPDGELRSVYRKIHMFDVEVDGVVYAESDNEEPGDEVVVTELANGVRLGMSVCYDVRFPELYRAASADGAEVLVVPAAFTLATTRDHWEVLLRARAIENQCYVLAPAQHGRHSERRQTYGHSMLVDPWGLVVARASDGEGLALGALNMDLLADIRRKLPALSHRRL